MRCFTLRLFAFFALVLFGIISFSLTQNAFTPPGGVIIVPGANETYTPPVYYYNASFTTGGYTQLTPGQTQQSEIWQGFFGNITSIMSLANSAGKSFYNWTVLNVSGMLYVTTNSSPNWEGAANDVSASKIDELWGFGAWSDNATQTFTADSNTAFTIGKGVGSVSIAANTRDSMNTFSGGAVVPGVFEEVLLANDAVQSGKNSLIFASFVNNLKTSFNSSVQAHYQIIVPNNQRNATTLDIYYFYFELD